MPQKIQTTYKRVPDIPVNNIGDSLSKNQAFSTPDADQFWPKLLEIKLRKAGYFPVSTNCGIAGDTTQMMVNRKACMLTNGVPAIGIAWGGVNDPFNSIVGSGTQANLVTLINTWLNAGCKRILLNNTQYLNLPSNGDTLDIPYAPYATLRPFQQAAVDSFATGATAGMVSMNDTYTFMRNIIGHSITIDGVTTNVVQGDASWHTPVPDQHLNVFGNQIICESVYQKLLSLGWLDALR